MRPLIAVTGRPTAAGRPWRLPGVGAQDNYLAALERAGALGAVLQPLDVPDHEVARRLERFDGLLLTGGPDVDPALYGRPPHPRLDATNAVVDRFEVALIGAALARRLPVLAVCRGLQVLNVARGGTLHQHITDRPGGADHGRPGVSAGRLAVEVAPGSLLHRALGATEARTSCFHHQAVDRLGRGLRVTARAPDGVVEGLELDDGVLDDGKPAGWLLAVQWHPETVAEAEDDQQALFDAFAAASAGSAADATDTATAAADVSGRGGPRRSPRAGPSLPS